jgi:hypothetical protein
MRLLNGTDFSGVAGWVSNAFPAATPFMKVGMTLFLIWMITTNMNTNTGQLVSWFLEQVSGSLPDCSR